MLLTSSHNCWAMDPDPAEVHSPHTIAIPAPNDLQLEIDTLIDRIFIRARGEEELEKALYRSLNIQVSEVEQEFTRLLAKAPYNDNLKFYFACFLLHNKRYVEGLTQYSQFLLYGQKSGKLVTDFMDSFKKIAVAGEKLKPFVQKIQDVLRDEKKFIADNNWTHLPKPQQQKRIHNDLLKNATSLLGSLTTSKNIGYS